MKPQLHIDWTPFDEAERAAVDALDAQESEVKSLLAPVRTTDGRAIRLARQAPRLDRLCDTHCDRTTVTLDQRRPLIARARRVIIRYRREWRRMIRRCQAEINRRRFLAEERPPGRGAFSWMLRRMWWRFRRMFR